MSIKATKESMQTRKTGGVGQTIGERRANPLENQAPAAPQVKAQGVASSFGKQAPKSKNLAQFAPGATYNSAVKHFSQSSPYKRAAHHIVEDGLKNSVQNPQAKLPDDKLLNFLDKVIDHYSPKSKTA